ncbi:MAG: hypothetical protein F6K28_07375 [Microcoleus sp. SIO2G3]|nr:hypothetical protein [Microcoleus sp. SIO2G3]
MTSQAPTIYSLQAPKDVSLSEIEAELSRIWQSYGIAGEDGALPAATRATTFSLVVYEPEETQYLLATLGFYKGPIDGILGPQMKTALREVQKTYGLTETGTATDETLGILREELTKRHGNGATADNGSAGVSYVADTSSPRLADEIASRNPCRIIALTPIAGEDVGVKAQVSAYCPIQKQSASTLVCCEYITLTGTAAALERIGGMIPALLIGGLPKFLWWKATPDPSNPLFKRLAAVCNNVIVDSCYLSSTNAQANAGTLICSETGGCMRMETQGGAQSSGVFQQVSSLSEQKAEALLSQQVQRWGHEALFEESLGVTTQILKLGLKK